MVLFTITTPLAEAGGAYIFLGVVVVFLLAIAYGYWTRRGSGINQRPWRGGSATGSPGAEGPSRMSSADRDDDVPHG